IISKRMRLGIPCTSPARSGCIGMVAEFNQLVNDHVTRYQRGQQRNDSPPCEHGTCHEYTGNLRTNNVSDTKILWCNLTVHCCRRPELVRLSCHPRGHFRDDVQYLLQDCIPESYPHTEEGSLRKLATFLSSL